MKANEIEDRKVLMIGDIVVGCIETDIVGEATYKIPCKVTDINHYGDVSCEALKPFPDELDWQDGDDFSWIEPIPLTPEILEKNGWEKRPTGCVFYTDGKRYDNSLWYIFGSNTFVVNTAEFQIKYVHELQHALRLCRIKKEIEL